MLFLTAVSPKARGFRGKYDRTDCNVEFAFDLIYSYGSLWPCTIVLSTRREPAKGDPMIDRTPLGRFAEPWEMAHGVLYLVSPASTQMCGQMLLLDGGITTTGTPCGF